MAIGPDALEPGQRELLRRLVRAKRTEEVADELELDRGQVETAAQAALVALDPALAALVAPQDRRLLGAYVLRRGGDGAAVAAVLDASADARRWALWLGEALSVLAPDATPVPMPSPQRASPATPGPPDGARGDPASAPQPAPDDAPPPRGARADPPIAPQPVPDDAPPARGDRADPPGAPGPAQQPAPDDAPLTRGDRADPPGAPAPAPQPAPDDVPLTRGDRAILALTFVVGLVLLALGIALS